MSIKTLQKSMNALPAQAREMMLAFSILMNRIGSLSKADRSDLFELLTEWGKETDPDERANVQDAMLEIIAAEPITATPLDLDPSASLSTEFAKFFGRKVKQLREKAGLSQQQLAETIGIPQSYVSRIENGEHAPTFKTRAKFAGAFGVETRELDPTSE